MKVVMRVVEMGEWRVARKASTRVALKVASMVVS